MDALHPHGTFTAPAQYQCPRHLRRMCMCMCILGTRCAGLLGDAVRGSMHARVLWLSLLDVYLSQGEPVRVSIETNGFTAGYQEGKSLVSSPSF